MRAEIEALVDEIKERARADPEASLTGMSPSAVWKS